MPGGQIGRNLRSVASGKQRFGASALRLGGSIRGLGENPLRFGLLLAFSFEFRSSVKASPQHCPPPLGQGGGQSAQARRAGAPEGAARCRDFGGGVRPLSLEHPPKLADMHHGISLRMTEHYFFGVASVVVLLCALFSCRHGNLPFASEPNKRRPGTSRLRCRWPTWPGPGAAGMA